jgi:hypothetical protein
VKPIFFSLVFMIGLVAPVSALGEAGLRLEVARPAQGERIENRVRRAFVQGSVAALGARDHLFDVMLVLDISQSTGVASGSDIDGDGEVGIDPRELPPGIFGKGTLSSDPEDTVLHAEVGAADALLRELNPKHVRLGLVTFSGDFDPSSGRRRRPDQTDAWLEVPLTDDYAAVQGAAHAVLSRGPRGATNFAEGIRLAVRELAGLPGAQSHPRAEAKKMILFLTDGAPTFPVGSASVVDEGDVEAAIGAAGLAARAGIPINTYAIGGGALQLPRAVTEIARVTGGHYTAVRNPGDIVALLKGISFVDVDDVILSNLSTGDLSTEVRLAPDGGFRGFVPVREGYNRIRVTALATDGSRAHRDIEIEFGATEFTDRELALELEQVRRASRELVLEVERKRVEDFRRRARKELELEIEKDRVAP